MKTGLYIAAAGVFYLSGCSPEYPCTNYVLNKIRFETPGVADTVKDTMQDTAVFCQVYKKGSDFTSPIDSDILPLSAPNINVRLLDFGKRLPIREQFDRYDWCFTMYPTKRRYDVVNISFTARYTSNNDRYCSNNLRYTVNGAVQKKAGASGAGSLSGEIKINY